MGFVIEFKTVERQVPIITECFCDQCKQPINMLWGKVEDHRPRPDAIDGFCFGFLQMPDWRQDNDTIVVLCEICKDELVKAFPAFAQSMKYLMPR